MKQGPIPSLIEARRRERTAEPTHPQPAHDQRPGDGPTVAVPTQRLGVQRALSVVALQRSAGNAAVTALLAAKARPAGPDKVADIDAALREARNDQPQLDTLEKGLKVAKDAGVPVDIDGAGHKPPASALAVTRTGFGPSSVPAKKPVPSPKPTPAASPMAKAARPAPKLPSSAAGAARPSAAGSVGAIASNGVAVATGPVNVLAPPERPTRTSPVEDPAFTAVTTAVGGVAKAKAAHPSAGSKAKEAQDAAHAPADDVDSQAKAAKVDTMDAQPAGSFDKKAFIEAVKAAIEAKSPKNLEQADKLKESGQTGQVKDEVKGLVGSNKEHSAEAIETATDAAPDASKAVPKPAAPLPAESAGPPAAVPAGGAAPKPAPPDQLNLEAGKHEANQELANADVSEQQLATSNEPQFTGALAAKQEAAQHAETAPGQYREHEAATLASARTEAGDNSKAAVAGIQDSKVAALAQVTGSKSATKSADEAKRAEVSAKVQSIFGATETEVKKILDGIDPKVDKAFTEGEQGARARFEAFVEAKMSAYKKDRYGGWLGGFRWAKDKLFDMPSEVNEFYAAGRELYLKEMDRVISNVADIVGADLGAAKARIAKGKADIAAYVKTLGPELKQVGAQAAQQVGEQFGKLESDVAAKQDAVVDTLASKYVECRQGLDDRIEALQAENKGLVSKAVGALKDVVATILKLKDMLLNVLARAAAAIGKIIKDPIGFLGNFVTAVKTGIVNFGTNILEHLKKGLQKWLFGALAEGGIQLPEKWDLKGVIQLVLSILGLTWERIKARIFAKVPGLQPVWDKLVGAFEVIKILITEGVGGLWKWVLEKAGDIKEMVMSQIKEMVVTQIVKAGITWLISMLNPAGAFIKACKMIYDVVMFFVERAAQIKEFVDAVLDSVESIAAGGVGAVAAKIEDTLGKLVPILIGFLASLLGLGGISDKIKKILEMVQKPVMKVVDWVIGKAVGIGKRLIGVAKRVGGKIKAKGKELLGRSDRRTPAQRKAALARAMAAGQPILKSSLGETDIRARLESLRRKYNVKRLELVVDRKDQKSETVHLVGANSPTVHGSAVTRFHLLPTVQRSESEDIHEQGAPEQIGVGGQVYTVWRIGGTHVRVEVEDMGVEIKSASSVAAAAQTLTKGSLEMDKADAMQLANELGARGMISRQLLLQYVSRGPSDPAAFAGDLLKRGAATHAAIQKPVDDKERRRLVDKGVAESGDQREGPLSGIAHVFYPKRMGEWKPRQIQSNPTAGGSWGIEFVWDVSDSKPTVCSLGVVECDNDGRVVRVLEVNVAELKGGVTALVKVMTQAGWKVALRE